MKTISEVEAKKKYSKNKLDVKPPNIIITRLNITTGKGHPEDSKVSQV